MEFPRFILAERDALQVEITLAFEGVSRQGGVSWNEAEIADNYGSPATIARVRGMERDVRWQDLLANDSNFPGSGIGYWPFLDPIGFRYYLPAAMVLSLNTPFTEGIDFALTFPLDDARGYFENRWTLLNLRQRRCVKRFLQYMDVVERVASGDSNEWGRAYESYWKNIPDERPGIALQEGERRLRK